MTTKTKIILTADDKTKAAFKAATRSVTGLERSVARANTVFASFIGAGAIGGLIKSIADAGLKVERFERSFRAATGSAAAGAAEFKFARDTAQQLGLDLEATAGSYAKLTAAAQGTVLAGTETRKIFTSISEAAVVLGLSADQTQGALTAVEQIISKGKVSAEELRGQLGERLPGAFQIAARAIGKTTSELDEMLRKGELTAEDLLPKLADELHKTFGEEAESAVNDAQAAINRFNTALFELKVGIAEGGLLDALSSMATHIANIINPNLGIKLNEAAEEVARLTAEVEQFERLNERFPGNSGNIRMLEKLQSELDDASRAFENLAREQARLLNPDIAGKKDANVPIVMFEKAKNDLLDFIAAEEEANAKSIASFRRRYETAEQKIQRLREELNQFKGDLDPAEFARINSEIAAIWDDGLEEIVLKVHELDHDFQDIFKAKMPEHAKQAARNIQDTFADFLFDPFDDGLKGMLKGFLDVIRRMLAEATASKIFGLIGGASVGGGLGGFLSGLTGRASGGPVSDGTPYVVGEKGPELFVPNANGEIIPNNKMGGSVSIVNHYSFEAGADIATIQANIVPMLEQAEQNTLTTIQKLRHKGRF